MSEWPSRRIAELFDMQLGKMLSPTVATAAGQAPYLANRHVQWERVVLDDLDTMAFSDADREKYSLRAGDLLVCEGGEVGRSAVWRGHVEGVYFQKAIHRLRPRRPDVLTDYVVRVMRQAAQSGAFTELTSQTSIAHLTQEKLGLFAFLLPPLPEQRAIAAVLDTIDDAIQKTEQIIAKLQQVKQGLLHDLLTRGIDDNGELRDPERQPEQFQDSPLGRIPKGWRVARIGDIIESHQAGIYKDRSEYGEGSNIVGVADLFRHDSLDGQQFRLVRLTASEQSEFRLEAGDLVYAESSLVLDGIAKTLAVTEAGAGTTFAWHTRRLRPNRKSVRGAFLAFALGLPRTRAFVASRATQTALTGIPVAAYFETPVILPPVTEQDAISAMVMALEHQIKAEFAHSDKVKALKRGLAHDLLTGRVRTTSLPEFAA